MSIASELNRIISAKSDIRDAIIAKGVSVPSSATIDTYADYVSQISGGGGGLETVEVSQCIQGSPYKLSGVKFDYEEYGEAKTGYYFTSLSTDYDYTGDCQSAYDEGENEYFYIEARENDITFQFNNYLEGLYYSDESLSDWTYHNPSDPQTITVLAGEKLYLKRDSISGFGYMNLFEVEPDYEFNVGGNIMSLIFGDSYSDYLWSGDGHKYFNKMMAVETSFDSLLNGCTNLVSAEHLILVPFITVNYHSMFYQCTSLTTPPKSPATLLGIECYYGMFEGCSSLETAPELPATTLAQGCYRFMFNGCSSLNYIKCLATDISASNCTEYWVANVAASGTFVQADGMSDWQEGDDGYPTGWTVVDA